VIYKIAVIVLLLIFPASNLPSVEPSEDNDRDGLTDQFEQELLARFVPNFMVSARECDYVPAEFQPGAQVPQPSAKNGTIYGQVFKAALPGRPGAFLEIHYYHLWGRDCGRSGHELDAEYVSALITASHPGEPAASWKAVYWYAAAHEETACDASQGVRGAVIGAEQKGPAVWISAGKHASFLSPAICNGGCGGDDCTEMRRMIPTKLINLGEPGAPMNGAVWTGSPKWPLAAKMRTDFSDAVLSRLDAAKKGDIVSLNESQAPVKAVAHAGVSATNGVAKADQKTEAALGTSTDASGKALGKASASVGKSLKRALGAMWGILK
jgi:hypothetical protein